MKKSYACRQTGFASIVILLGIAVIVLIGGVVVYQKVLAPEANSTPTLTPTITTTSSSISQASPTPDLPNSLFYQKPEDLAKAFEEAIVKHDSDGAKFILSVYTAPILPEDKQTLILLEGKDLPYPPRLFNAAGAGGLTQELSYSIKSIKKSTLLIEITVEKVVNIFSNAINTPPRQETRECILGLVPDETLGWKVDYYHFSGPSFLVPNPYKYGCLYL